MTLQDVFIRRRPQQPPLTDDELMEQVRRGDEAAFRQLYERYKGPIFLYCLRMLNDRDAAKDVLQDVFIRLHTRHEQYEAGSNFAGWIHTIARNLCLNARRTQRGHASFDEAMQSLPSSQSQTSDVALREQLAAAIQSLPPLYREALILREYEDRSYDDIATILGATMSTVKFRIFKARELLRQRLAGSFDEYREQRDNQTGHGDDYR